MRSRLIFATALLASPAGAAPFDWMVGHWCTVEEKGVRTCEKWSGWSKGRLLGEGRTLKAGKIVETEVTTIRMVLGRAVYDASPDGAPIVRFTQTARGSRSIVFENRGHDYPQRIRYWREGGELLAEISLADGSKKQQWRYARTHSPP